MKDKKKLPYESLILLALVSVIWTLACVLKSVYPFGDGVISIGDMSEQSIPVYTFLWDVMHGQKSLFFDWDIGLGNNMAGSVSHFTLISPFNLFLFLIKRNAIESSMFYFFLIKIIAIALGMRFVLRKWFPGLDARLLCTVCVLYAFCPFLVEYYRIPSWYDIAFVFPFVMYYYVELMSGRKKGFGYALSLALFAVMSFQHVYMLAVLLILMTGGFLVIDRHKYGAAMPRFIGYSILAALLSACVLLPGTLQIMTAGRLGGKFDLVEIWGSVYIFFPEKWMKLINLGIPFGLMLCGIRKNWGNREFRWLLYVDMLLLLPIVLESTNLLWHGGPYESYSMRFSYMLAFWVMVTGIYGYQLNRERISRDENVRECANFGVWQKAVRLIFVVELLFLGLILYYLTGHDTTIALIVLVTVLSMAAACLFYADTALYGQTGNFLGAPGQTSPLAVGLVLLAAAVSVAILQDNIRIAEHVDDSGVKFYNMLRETEAGSQRPALDRIKNLEITSQNYPQLLNRSAIGNYTASEGYDQIYSVVDMGYALVGNRMSDWGGTVFSDALMGITQVMTSGEVNQELYTKKEQKQGYWICDCNDAYQTGILIRQDWDASAKGQGNPFGLQNEMAESILGTGLFALYETQTDMLQIPVNEKSILYAYVPGVPDPVVTVQEIKITNQDTGAVLNRAFTSGWDNGIVNLGIYEGSVLDIAVQRAEDIGTMYFALLPIERLREQEPLYAGNFQYTTTGHSLTADLTDAAEGDRLFLPIYHDAGWTCKVNDRSVIIETFLSGGMVIPLAQGDNRIELVYCPPGFKPGVLCSVLGGIFWLILWKKPAWEARVSAKTERAAGYLILAAWGGFMIVFYGMPIVFLMRFLVKLVLP